jgi:hypothetical protein
MKTVDVAGMLRREAGRADRGKGRRGAGGGGGGGGVTSTIITSFPLGRKRSWMSIKLLNFTHPRDQHAACPTPPRWILITLLDYRVALGNSWLQRSNADSVLVFLLQPLTAD